MILAKIERLLKRFDANSWSPGPSSGQPEDGTWSASSDDFSDLKNATLELQVLVSDLQSLHDSCFGGTDVKHAKWMWKKKKVTHLCERARTIHLQLQLAALTISMEEPE